MVQLEDTLGCRIIERFSFGKKSSLYGGVPLVYEYRWKPLVEYQHRGLAQTIIILNGSQCICN